MQYKVAVPITAAIEQQTGELGRLLKHSKQLTVQFVTVAGRYQPRRGRVTVLTVPDRLTDPALRVLEVLTGHEQPATRSEPVRQREEWTQHALLVPTDPEAAPPDGTLLDGWHSVCLTVVYQPGRAVARLACCVEDAERLKALALPGWRLTLRPNPLARATAGGAWRGVPSLRAVPGGVVPAAPATPAPAEAAPGVPTTPPMPELTAALTNDESGLLLGVGKDGAGVRLARRAQTLALVASPEMRSSALLALMRRGMQSGLGLVIALDRSLLPSEALAAWDARLRLLDVQDVASSGAIPWRQIAPDLLAQAIGGPQATLSHLPARFGAVLDMLGASVLRVPEVLGLATMPGDDLRGVLAAGGIVVVPQDGDAASTIVARLLLAYLATPPAIGRALLLLTDAALVAPAHLRDQAIQVVVGERRDALLRLHGDRAGWRLSGPDGSPLAELLPDLMAQPTVGDGAIVETIIGALREAAPAAEQPPAWWDTGPQGDDLGAPDEPDPLGEIAGPDELAGAGEDGAGEPEMAIEPVDAPDGAESLSAEPSPLDEALDGLFAALMADADTASTDIRAAIAQEAFGAAEALARSWTDREPSEARAWCWLIVLTQDDAERGAAAQYVLAFSPDNPYAAWLRVMADQQLADGGARVPPPGSTDQPPDSLASIAEPPELLRRSSLPSDPALLLAGAPQGVEAAHRLPDADDRLREPPAEPFMLPTQPADEEVEAVHDLPNAGDRGWELPADPFMPPVQGVEGGAEAAGGLPDAHDREWELSAAPFMPPAPHTNGVAPDGVEAAGGLADAHDRTWERVAAPFMPPVQGVEGGTEAAGGLADARDRAWELPPDPFMLLGQPASEDTEAAGGLPDDRDRTWELPAEPFMPPAPHTNGVAHEGAEAAGGLADARDRAIEPSAAPFMPPAPHTNGTAHEEMEAAGGLPDAGDRLSPVPGASISSSQPADILDDAAIRARWQAGESTLDLIANFIAVGVDPATARTRVRQAIKDRPAAPAAPVTPPMSPEEPPAAMIGIGAPIMAADGLDDTEIWRRWEAGERTDDMVFAMCERRGGARADAARDRIYAVAIPRIVEALRAQELVARLVAGGDVSGDPHYTALMKRLARSEVGPAGSLEQSLRRRLVAVYAAQAQEV